MHGCYIDKQQVSSFYSNLLFIVLSLVTVTYFPELHLTYCKKYVDVLLTKHI